MAVKNAFMVGSLVLISNIANAADHRLAFSQSAKLEVMVEHKDGDNWCSNAPVLRFQDSGAASLSVLEQTMPKLGALLARECPAASSVTWYSIDADGNKLQAGIAGAASEWKLQTNQANQNEALAAATQTEVTPETTENKVNSEEVVEAKTEPSLQESASEPQALANKDTAVQTSVNKDEAKTDLSQAQQVAEKVAEAQQPDSGQQVQDSLTAPVPSIDPTLESAKSSEEVVPNNEEKALVKSPVSDPNKFDVNGWTPVTTSEALKGQTVKLQLKDQNGCVFNSQFDFDIPVEYIGSQSKGITCGPDSLAMGKGEWRLTRSDGRQLVTISAYFRDGLAFRSLNSEFEIQKVVPNEKIWLHIGSEPLSKVHYLVEGEFNRQSTWQFSQPKVIAVTENTDYFKNVNDIEKIIDTAIRKIQTHLDTNVSRMNFVAVDDFEAWVGGMKNRDTSNQLYSIGISKPWSRKGWQYNLQYGENHLFEREKQKLLAEKREAERQESLRKQAEWEAEQAKRQAARMEAMKQQRYLQDYQTITKQTLEQRMSNWFMEIEYDFPKISKDYMMLMEGERLRYRQIVELQKRDKQGNWIVKNPYPGQLVDASHIEKSGWYQLSGTVELDPSVKDDDGFPLSIFRAEQLTECEDKTCIEQFNPLQIIRNISGDENWEPEAASLVIEKYESGQFE